MSKISPRIGFLGKAGCPQTFPIPTLVAYEGWPRLLPELQAHNLLEIANLRWYNMKRKGV